MGNPRSCELFTELLAEYQRQNIDMWYAETRLASLLGDSGLGHS